MERRNYKWEKFDQAQSLSLKELRTGERAIEEWPIYTTMDRRNSAQKSRSKFSFSKIDNNDFVKIENSFVKHPKLNWVNKSFTVILKLYYIKMSNFNLNVALVVVKWSACLPSSPMIRVRIPISFQV